MKVIKHEKIDPRVKREAEARKLGFRNYAELVHERTICLASGRFDPTVEREYIDNPWKY